MKKLDFMQLCGLSGVFALKSGPPIMRKIVIVRGYTLFLNSTLAR